MRITHLGHACLLIEAAGQRILIDPGAFVPDFAEATWRLGLTKFPNDPTLLKKLAPR